jgi:beta-lactamase regulating signal transducer with metallopeptidase domain
MTLYLLKASLCSALLLTLYELILAKEKTYRFNRFYLLFSLIFSAAVPLIDIELTATQLPQTIQENIYHSPENSDTMTLRPDGQYDGVAQNLINNNWLFVIWGFYLSISTLLFIRFVRNSYTLLYRYKKTQSTDYQNVKIALNNETITPYSFWNTIFLNKSDYENGKIKKEILWHELTHIKQRHSLDVIFVELLTVAAWVNPALYFYRKAIVLNHEFLADEAVVQTYQNIPVYQYLLLNTIQSNSLPFTSPFNYLITKKRFVMMNKSTNSARALFAQLSVLPLLAAATFTFSSISVAQKTTETKASLHTQEGVSAAMLKEYNEIAAKYLFKISEKSYQIEAPSKTDQKRLETIFEGMSKNQQESLDLIMLPPPLPRTLITEKVFASYKNAKIYGVWVNDKKVSNTVLDKYKAADFAQVFVSRLYGNAQKTIGHKYKFQVDMMTTDYYEKYRQMALADGKYMLMSNSKKRKS